MGLYKRGKVWYASLAGADGKLIRKSLSTDKRTAETIYGHMRTQIALKRAGVISEIRDPVLCLERKTLVDIYREYLDRAKFLGRSNSYFEAFDLVWRQIIGNRKKPEEITAVVIQNWVTKKQQERNKNQTINFRLGLFRAFLSWATEQGYFKSNPMGSWIRLRVTETTTRRDFTTEEVSVLLATEKDRIWKLRWLVYFYTGLRKMAGASMSWDWIDWPNKIITVPIKNNKSGKEHRIPMHPELYRELQEYHQELGSPDGHIFEACKPAALLRRFKELVVQAGISLDGVCLHSVRHTVATKIYEATGKDLKAVQEVLGHSNVAVTALYLHVGDDVKRNAVESIRYS